MICLVIFTLTLFYPTNISLGMQAPPKQVILTHKKRPPQELIHPIPSSIGTKSLVHLNALLEQTDHFSCVYRSLFHAQCLIFASQEVIKGKMFRESLKIKLLDENLLNLTFNYLKDYLDTNDPTHDKTRGVCLHHLIGVCAAKIPLLHTHLLPIFLDDDQNIYALHDPTPARPSPLHYSADFIRSYGTSQFPEDVCKKELDQSAELAYQLKKLEDPNCVVHFGCMYKVSQKKHHLFLASIITNKHKKAKLYIIDSGNSDLATTESLHVMTAQLLIYVKALNAKRSSKKTNLSPV